jgi:hypothetical protein
LTVTAVVLLASLGVSEVAPALLLLLLLLEELLVLALFATRMQAALVSSRMTASFDLLYGHHESSL